MIFVFSLALFVLFYINAGYPLYLFALSKLRRRRIKINLNFAPRITLIIPAYNEEKHIGAKIENALSMTWPYDKYEIIVSSDNSSDRTVAIAKEYAAKHPKLIRVNDFKERSGKLGLLNKSIKDAAGDIVVFTDANAMFDKESFVHIAKYFADESVGCVSGAKVVIDDSTAGTGEGAYWKLESFIKKAESRISSCAGADGAIYAIRRELYPFPDARKLLMDDFVISLSIMKKGFRCVYDEKIRAFEGASKSLKDEFKRKARIFAGAFNVLLEHPTFFNLNYSGAWHVWSHKILRWFSWLFLLLLFVSNLLLLEYPFFKITMLAQIVLYVFAYIGYLLEKKGKGIKLFYIPFYFLFMVSTQFYGLYVLFRDRYKPAWEKLDR